MCKCTSVLESAANGTASTIADDKKQSEGVTGDSSEVQRSDGDADMDMGAS